MGIVHATKLIDSRNQGVIKPMIGQNLFPKST